MAASHPHGPNHADRARERSRAALQEWRTLRHEVSQLESTRAIVLLAATGSILVLFLLILRALHSPYRNELFMLLHVPILITMLSAAAYRRRIIRVRAYLRTVLEPSIPGINFETGLAHFDHLSVEADRQTRPRFSDLFHNPGRLLAAILGASSGYQLAELTIFVALSVLASAACVQNCVLDEMSQVVLQEPQFMPSSAWYAIAIGTLGFVVLAAVRLHNDTMRGGGFDRQCEELWKKVVRDKISEQADALH